MGGNLGQLSFNVWVFFFRRYANCVPRRRNAKYGFLPRFFSNDYIHLQRMEFIQWEAIWDSFRFMFGSFFFRRYANCVPRRRNAKYGFSPRFFSNDYSHLQRTEHIEPW